MNRLAENLTLFTRALREAGLRVGTSQLETAARAVSQVGLRSKRDLFYTLEASLLSRAEDRAVFAQVFELFWRDPDFLGRMLHMASPLQRTDEKRPDPKAAHRRAVEAIGQPPERNAPPPREEVTRDALFSWSGNEVLCAMDFEQMSAAELRLAEAAIGSLQLPVRMLPARRFRTGIGKRPDPSATLRAAQRKVGEITRISYKAPQPRPPDLVAICDISGSMSVYSRMILLYLHSLAHARIRAWGMVSAFTFGTRLTNVTRALRQGDPDAALSLIGMEAPDWQGGTRIGDAIERFNKDWSRRVLGQGAVVLLITDGLERDDPDRLARAAELLNLTARAVIWLNPLLRFDAFEPQAQGVRALLPHVTSLHACHSLDSLAQLSVALGERGLKERLIRAMRIAA